MMSPAHLKLMRRIAIFVVSAAASALIGIYIKGLVTQEAEITFEISIDEFLASDQSDAIKFTIVVDGQETGAWRSIPVTKQRIRIRNTSELPLEDFTISVSWPARWGDSYAPPIYLKAGFGTPVIENFGPGADCQVLKNDRSSITWKCPLLKGLLI